MVKSVLATVDIQSSKNSGKRTKTIDRITPHCFVGQVTAQKGAEVFKSYDLSNKASSCNYVIGKDGDVASVVYEDLRSWCSSSTDNDQRAVTIECSSDKVQPYAFTDSCWNTLVELCVDICKRNGKNKLIWIDDKSKALAYVPQQNEMLITVHRWFAKKACPGDWCMSKLGELASSVTNKLNVTEQVIVQPIVQPVPVQPVIQRKSNEEIAKEVIDGKWSNGDDRKAKLQAAGYNYTDIQNIINGKKPVEEKPNYVVRTDTAKSGLFLHNRVVTSTSSRLICMPFGTKFTEISKSGSMSYGYCTVRNVKYTGYAVSSYLV